MSTMFGDFGSVDAMPRQVESTSRIFGLSAGKSAFRPTLLSQDSARLNMQFGSGNNVDYISEQRHRTSVMQTTTLGGRPFGLQSRSVTSHSSVIPESSFRLNQELRQRSSNTSTISKPFWPAVRNTTLTTGLQMQDSVKYDDDIIDNDGFRRPSALRIIRGRNSTLSSRLFNPQNTDRHYKDLSSINGFNVSHISRRDVDSLSESRLPLGMRSNWMENQSLSGSVISVVSMKAQFMNLLENLHHSILSIGPHVSADAVRMEFDKAKQGLENISEMSFAPSIKPADSASIVSQSSKYMFPPINGEATTTTTTGAANTLDGGSLHLKSGKDLLKTLVSSQNNYKRRIHLSTHMEEEEGKDDVISSSRTRESEDEENSSFVFKKPRGYTGRSKTTRMKINAPPPVKKPSSKTGGKTGINLKQWYPIAVGSDLAFCGVDEKGSSVETDAVKKRLSNRKVELMNGIDCNLIGSPSAMVSVLPEKIVTRLKNGLPDRWRVLQKELSSCQTAAGETGRKRTSKSPKVRSPQEKKVAKRRGRPVKESSKRPRVVSTPKKRTKESHTRSGRAVKRPGMFWLANGSNEITSTLELSEATVEDVPKKKPRRSTGRSPAKKVKKASPASVSPRKARRKVPEETPNDRKESSPEESPVRKAKASGSASPRKHKKTAEESPSKKYKKANEETPIGKYKMANEESPSRKAKSPGLTSAGKYKGATGHSPSRKSPGALSPRKHKVATEESPGRKVKSPGALSPRKRKMATEKSPLRKVKSPGALSPRKNKMAIEKSPRKKASVSPRARASPVKRRAAAAKTSERKSTRVTPTQKKRKESKEEVEVHSSTEATKRQSKSRYQRGKRKREMAAEADSVQAKKSKLEKKTETEVESTVKSTESVTKGGKKTKIGLTLNFHPAKPKGRKPPATKSKMETVKKKTVTSALESHNETTEFTEFEKNFDFKLDDIEIPEMANVSGNPQLSRSQLRLVSMETPPLKYFNSNLRLLGSTTPMRSPDWCISQRTESEVKQFQRRREEAFKKRIKMNIQKSVVTEKNGQSRDVKRVMEWVSEKAVRSPQWNSKVLQYVIPSRKRMEQEEDDEDVETEFF